LDTREHEVVIAGGGPTGMMLAGELALAGIDAVIVERRGTQDLVGSRASGIHARTVEVFDQRGIADRFVSQGQKYAVVLFNMMRLSLADFPTRHPYSLGIWQNKTEGILAGWIEELGAPIYRERAVTGFAQDDGGVDVRLSDDSSIRARYLVGCDGARSVIRKSAGIEFPGSDATTSWIVAEGEWSEEPAWGLRHDALGAQIGAIGRIDDARQMRIVLTEREVGPATEPTLRDVRDGLIAVYGTDFGIHNPVWISRFTDMTRQAASYRERRVLVAGDAAHVHPPLGGQGLNLGVQDAVNLGWKLAQVIRGVSSDALLDSYHDERHSVAARVLQGTMAQTALRRTDDRARALSDFVSELLRMDEPRRHVAAQVSGLGICYDLGEGHPLLGRRMPDLDLETMSGPLRVYTLLHDARPVLINFGAPEAIDIDPWSDRVRLVNAQYAGAWELPAIGAVKSPGAVLVRPDGYVAWVGDSTRAGLAEAMSTWFGAARLSREDH
jgi:3-(3-hydroxy-phenyl)propionate hydroxylase